MKVIVISLYFLHVASAGLLLSKSNVNQTISTEFKRPESVCRAMAYANAVGCTLNGSYNGTSDNELECLTEVVGSYLNCTYTDILPQGTRRSLSTVLSAVSDEQTTLSEIKCIVDNVLDLIKCVVDGQLGDAAPYTWNWMVFSKCLISNIPSSIVCFKQGLL